MLSGGDGPFVLLDDARDQGVAARLFRDPTDIRIAATPADVEPMLAVLDDWHAAGDFAAGFLSYEAGYALEPKLARVAARAEGERGAQGPLPLGWFGRFRNCRRIDAASVTQWLPDGAGAAVGAPQPSISAGDYAAAIAAIHAHIVAGDIYQANLTFNATVAVHGHPLAIYARLRAHARAGYGGVVFTGSHWLLSLSPELFFALRGGQVIARPMKGTAARLADPAADRDAVEQLRSDPKQRAENLMIVDLLRNDLSRIAQPGSVAVPTLFRVETYPTIHQMVSDVTARIAIDQQPSAMIRALFPCGSITGAPKIRAMEIIAETEAAPRGAYTGSMGFIGPDGEAAFNVAIRTLALPDKALCATLGLGSGVVADSSADAEWRECLAKGEFVRVAQAQFDLLETMRFEPDDGIALLDRHLARLGASAHALGFAFDRHAVRNMLQHATFHRETAARVRLRLSRRGACAIAVEDLPPQPAEPVTVTLSPRGVDSHDIRLVHKTSDRSFYDAALAASGAFETVLVDDAGRVTEGCFTSLFVERDGMLLTPPLSLGLLPGVLRAELIDTGRAREAVLHAADLSAGGYIGNALRGLIRFTLAQ